MRKFLTPFLVIFLVGCSGVVVPESPRESLTATETAYQAALGVANDFIAQGLITQGDDNAQILVSAILTARAALDAWHLIPDSTDRMTVAIASLRVLQSTLNTLKTKLQGQGA